MKKLKPKKRLLGDAKRRMKNEPSGTNASGGRKQKERKLVRRKGR